MQQRQSTSASRLSSHRHRPLLTRPLLTRPLGPSWLLPSWLAAALLGGLAIAAGIGWPAGTTAAEPGQSPGVAEATGATLPAAAGPPNVVIIFIDDMAYGDIGPFGATAYRTPHLDRMAAQGRRFTDFVVSSAVCSSSRAGLMTGCYHQRVGIDGALTHRSEIGLNESELTIAQLCRSRGYATACYGKWHLGHHPRFLPTNHGFDHYLGIPYSNDMWPLHPQNVARLRADPTAESAWPPLPLLESSQPGQVTIRNREITPADQQQMTRLFTQAATDFIRDHADQPFFVYLPHPMVHVPLYVSDQFAGKSGTGLFGDVVMEIDWSVGQILQTLDELQLTENTLVIFTSDNGPWLSYGDHAGSAGPLREGKGTMFEGGYRVPCLMQWKGTIPAGSDCDQLCSTIDLLPTIANLIGGELPTHPIDGRDLTPLLLGEPGARSPHDYFFCYYAPSSLHAVRTPRWKLHFPHPYRTLNGRPGGSGGEPVAYQQARIELALFDLDNDIGETTDVAEQYPEVVAQLSAAADAMRARLGDRLQQQVGDEVRPPGTLAAGDQRLQW